VQWVGYGLDHPRFHSRQGQDIIILSNVSLAVGTGAPSGRKNSRDVKRRTGRSIKRSSTLNCPEARGPTTCLHVLHAAAMGQVPPAISICNCSKTQRYEGLFSWQWHGQNVNVAKSVNVCIQLAFRQRRYDKHSNTVHKLGYNITPIINYDTTDDSCWARFTVRKMHNKTTNF